MNKLFTTQGKKIQHYIAKPHFQVFLASFSICILSFFMLSRNSDSNVGSLSAGAASPLVTLESSPARLPSSTFFDDMFSSVKEVEFDIKGGDSISSLLSGLGISPTEILEVSSTIDAITKISDLRPGTDRLVVKIKPIEDEDGGRTGAELRTLEIVKSPVYRVRAEKTPAGYKTVEERSDISAELVRKEGAIDKGGSLIEIATRAGIPYNIVDKFYEIFSFDVDFERDIYPGDTFQVMYEQLYSEKGESLGAGELVFASLYLNSRKSEFKLYRYEDGKGRVAYYNENGQSAIKTLKKTPINGARISSKYGSRRHPILGYTRDHKGVDFAAMHGTPIPAAGNGTVVERGWKPGYGNYIKIKHNGTYSTAYGHMSSFKKGVTVGTRVSQGQTVGFVGNTGLSTGPHLHYEIIKDGAQVNPLTVKLPSTQKLSEADMAKFNGSRDKINIQFAVLDKNFSQFAHLVDLNSIDPVKLK
ncbi:MAG: M23 family metallopeptidase [Rickettsiales bacterium]|jgi:murein DD-endopeptidase MepM/ murein hydrolase activator NlpD|nr:M23 family metallopeptidase [Rickettsiales bacterium]